MLVCIESHSLHEGLTSLIMVNWLPTLGIDVCSCKFLVISQGIVQEMNVKSTYLPHYCSVKSPLSAGLYGSGLQLTSAQKLHVVEVLTLEARCRGVRCLSWHALSTVSAISLFSKHSVRFTCEATWANDQSGCCSKQEVSSCRTSVL